MAEEAEDPVLLELPEVTVEEVVVFTTEQAGSSEHGGAVTSLRAKVDAGL